MGKRIKLEVTVMLSKKHFSLLFGILFLVGLYEARGEAAAGGSPKRAMADPSKAEASLKTAQANPIMPEAANADPKQDQKRTNEDQQIYQSLARLETKVALLERRAADDPKEIGRMDERPDIYDVLDEMKSEISDLKKREFRCESSSQQVNLNYGRELNINFSSSFKTTPTFMVASTGFFLGKKNTWDKEYLKDRTYQYRRVQYKDLSESSVTIYVGGGHLYVS